MWTKNYISTENTTIILQHYLAMSLYDTTNADTHVHVYLSTNELF